MKIEDTEKPNARRGRRLGFDRAQALEKALKLFWTRGYEGTSIADLVEAMGVNPPSLYTAFGSKESLYREAVDLYANEYADFLQTSLDEAPTAYQAIHRLLGETVKFLSSDATPSGCMVSTALLYAAPQYQEIAAFVSGIRLSIIERVKGRLDRGVSEGDLPPEVNTEGLARHAMALIQGMSVQARDGAGPEVLMDMVRIALTNWPGAR